MRITSKEIFTEDNQGQILLQTAGTTRLTVDGTGNITTAGTVTLSGGTVSSLTASSPSFTSPTLTGTITLGGASDTIGFYGATAVAVQSSTATTAAQAFVGGGATAATSASRWSGDSGTKAYTIGDVVSAMKKYGLLAS